MTLNIHRVGRKRYSKEWCQAFQKGAGGVIVDEPTLGTWAGYGAPALHDNLQECIRAGYDFYYGDHAYFGRGKFWRVTKNAYQHDGRGEPDFKRLAMFHTKVEPWKKGGRHILVCTQTERYYERMGQPNWLENILNVLKIYTDRDIIVRHKNITRPLKHDLNDAFCVICYSSNVAVEAIMQGIPVITTGDCAASRMGLHDPANVEKPYYPDDRMEWAATLAANQWTLKEIAAGQCWEKIK